MKSIAIFIENRDKSSIDCIHDMFYYFVYILPKLILFFKIYGKLHIHREMRYI